MPWKTSRFTHLIELESGEGTVYNGRTGALVKLAPGAFQRCRSLLAGAPAGHPLPVDGDGDSLFQHLAAGGFVVSSDLDELALLEESWRRERESSQFLLTILPTFGCNLGCEYCFVGKKRGLMNRERQDQIIDFVTARLRAGTFPSMAVDWFGGEPLLALNVIDRLSNSFLQLCETHGMPYSAQVITNGTVISERAVDVMLRGGVDRLQITLDGPREVHDRRRPSKLRVVSSFDQIMEGLEKVVGRFLIRLRINVDRHNMDAVWPLLDSFASRGWLGPDKKFYPHLARLSPFTDACASTVTEGCSVDELQEMSLRWLRQLHQLGVPVAFQGLYQFPSPKLYNCGAIGPNGFIFTPEGEIHKCGLAVDDSSEAIGVLGEPLDPEHPNAAKWRAWEPFSNPVCRECAFFPSCLGGCPRNQMQGRETQKRENCQYYQRHENRILAAHLELAAL